MKVEIPDEIAKEIGIFGLKPDEIDFEVTELAWRALPDKSMDDKSQGVIIYAKADEPN